MKKRILAMLLCVMLACTMLVPVTFASADYDDYVPGAKPANMILKATDGNRVADRNWTFGNLVNANYPNFTFEEKSHSPAGDGYYGKAGPSWFLKSTGSLSENLTTGTTYAVAVNFANGAPEKKETVIAAVSHSNCTNPLSFEVTSAETKTYTGVFTAVSDSGFISYGFDGSVDRSSVTDADRGKLIYDASSGADSFYVAEEAAYDISVQSDVSSVVVGDVVIVDAMVLNQVGLEMSGTPDFEYYVVNEGRTAVVSGFDITVSSDTKTAEVIAGDSVAPGTYFIIAEDGAYGIDGFRKGVAVEVKKGAIKDTEPSEDPYYDVTMDVTEGSNTIGMFDKLTIKAKLIESNGSIGTNPQSFTWYVLDSARLEEVTEGIILDVSDDSTEANVYIDADAIEDTYYVVAESEGLRQSVEIIVDKSGDVSRAVEIVAQGDAEVIEANLGKISDVLELPDVVAEANISDFIGIVVSDRGSESITDKTSAKEYVQRCALVSLYNLPSQNAELMDEYGNFNYADELKLSDIDTAGVTLYAKANAYMTSEGKGMLKQSVTGRGFASYADFIDALCEELILKTIEYPSVKGTAYLTELFTEANLDYIGIDASAYFALANSKQFLANEIRGKNFTIETLEAALMSAYESDTTVLNADYVPEDKPESIVDGANLNALCSLNGAAATLDRSLDSQEILGYLEKTHAADSWFGAGTTIMSGSYLKKNIVKDTKYVVSLRLKNATPEKKETLKAAVAYGTSNTPVRFDVTDSEFMTYTATFTAKTNANVISMGLDSTVDRTGVTDATRGLLQYDYSDGGIYLAPEVVYDLGLDMENTKVEAGTTAVISAKVLNQIGEEYTSSAPEFTYYAVNEDRSAEIDGITFVPSSDTKSADVTVDADVAPGKYVLIAEDSAFGIDGFKKGIEITVTKPVIRDTEDSQYQIAVKSGNTTMGVFDDLTVEASASGSYTWYVLNSDRTDKIEDVIELQVSEDTTTVSVNLSVEVLEGTYYIVAESSGKRKSIELTVDKTNDVAQIIENIDTKTADEFAGDVVNAVKLLELGGTYVQKADATELAKVIVAGKDDETLSDLASLKEYFKRAAVVALYNAPADAVELSDEKGNFNYATELKLSDIDKEGVTLYSGAMSVMGKEGKKALQSKLTGKEIANYKAFMDKVEEELLLTAIRYPAKDGYGYLDYILTEANLKLFGIDASKYLGLKNNAEFAQTELVKETFTLKTLADTLADAYETQEDSSSSGSGGGSVGSSGGGGGAGGKLSFDGSAYNNTNTNDKSQEISEFNDVPATHWAYTDIQYLKSIGVINGVTADSFQPNASVTREQFLKLIMEAFELYGSNKTASFSDVDSSAWYAPYVNGAVELGIVNGKTDNVFGVGDAVTRQDACVMIDRALSLSGEIYEEAQFKDTSSISDYAKSSVSVLYGYGVINGMGDGSFAPFATCTRAQAAKIISSTLSLYNSLNLR